MRDFAKTTLAIVTGFVVLSIMTRISFSLALVFNILSLVVVYFAMSKGEVWGACVGMVCGLVHDSLSIGVFGIMGMAKTVTGYLAGVVAKKINIQSPGRLGVFLFLLFTLELLFWVLLTAFIFEVPPYSGRGILFIQPVVTALLGILIFPLVRKLKKRLDSPHES